MESLSKKIEKDLNKAWVEGFMACFQMNCFSVNDVAFFINSVEDFFRDKNEHGEDEFPDSMAVALINILKEKKSAKVDETMIEILQENYTFGNLQKAIDTLEKIKHHTQLSYDLSQHSKN